MSDQAPGHHSASRQILTPELAALGPNVIGATGGSGTRVVARIVCAGGMYVGTRLNRYEDALDFAEYSDRWINRYLRHRTEPDAGLAGEMASELRSLVSEHCSGLPPEAIRWGWKEPRSIYLVPFFRARMPTLSFLHFVRDGRDMAFSDNQQQLGKHGRAVLESRVSWRRPVRSIALWSRVNLAAAEFGERELGADYLRVRFEDLCAHPVATVGQIYAFFGLEGDVEATAALVEPPRTLGRWRTQRRRLVARLDREAEPALRRFGYLDA